MAEQTRRVFSRIFNDPGVTYMLAGAFTLAALSFFTQRGIATRTVVGRAVAPYDACWNGLYLLAGVFTLASCLSRARQIDPDGFEVLDRAGNDLRWEAAGLIALAGGFALNGGVAIAIQGLTDIRSYVFAVFLAGCSLRFSRIWRSR